jgi:hypothetical protein
MALLSGESHWVLSGPSFLRYDTWMLTRKFISALKNYILGSEISFSEHRLCQIEASGVCALGFY